MRDTTGRAKVETAAKMAGTGVKACPALLGLKFSQPMLAAQPDPAELRVLNRLERPIGHAGHSRKGLELPGLASFRQ